MFFDLANWIILGGAYYLLLNQVFSRLSLGKQERFSLQNELAVKIMFTSGTLVLLMQISVLLLGGYYFIFEDMPMSIGGKPYFFSLVLFIPVVVQLFRIKAIGRESKAQIILSIIILSLDLFFRLYNPFSSPRRHFVSSKPSILKSIENNPFLLYAFCILLFLLVLGILLDLKNERSKHKIEK